MAKWNSGCCRWMRAAKWTNMIWATNKTAATSRKINSPVTLIKMKLKWCKNVVGLDKRIHHQGRKQIRRDYVEEVCDFFSAVRPMNCFPGCFRPRKWTVMLMFWCWDQEKSLTWLSVTHECIGRTGYGTAIWSPTHSHVTCRAYARNVYSLSWLPLRFLGSNKCFFFCFKVDSL